MSRFTDIYLCFDAEGAQKKLLPSLLALQAELGEKFTLHVLVVGGVPGDRLVALSFPRGQLFESRAEFLAKARELALAPQNLLVVFYYRPGSPFLFDVDNTYSLGPEYLGKGGESKTNFCVYDFSTDSPVRAEYLLKYALTPRVYYPPSFAKEIPYGCQNKDYLYLTYILAEKMAAGPLAKTRLGSFAGKIGAAELGGYFRSLSAKIYGAEQPAELLLGRVWAKLEKDYPGGEVSARFAQVVGAEVSVLAASAQVPAGAPIAAAAVTGTADKAGSSNFGRNVALAGLAGLTLRQALKKRQPPEEKADWRKVLKGPGLPAAPAPSGFQVMAGLVEPREDLWAGWKEALKAPPLPAPLPAGKPVTGFQTLAGLAPEQMPLTRGMQAYKDKLNFDAAKIDANAVNLARFGIK